MKKCFKYLRKSIIKNNLTIDNFCLPIKLYNNISFYNNKFPDFINLKNIITNQIKESAKFSKKYGENQNLLLCSPNSNLKIIKEESYNKKDLKIILVHTELNPIEYNINFIKMLYSFFSLKTLYYMYKEKLFSLYVIFSKINPNSSKKSIPSNLSKSIEASLLEELKNNKSYSNSKKFAIKKINKTVDNINIIMKSLSRSEKKDINIISSYRITKISYGSGINPTEVNNIINLCKIFLNNVKN